MSGLRRGSSRALVGALVLCLVALASPPAANAARPSMLTTDQLKELLLTDVEAATATGFTGTLAEDPQQEECAIFPTGMKASTYCQGAWTTPSNAAAPHVVSVYVGKTMYNTGVLWRMAREIESSRTDSRILSSSATQLISYHRGNKALEWDFDWAMATGRKGRSLVYATCARPTNRASYAPLVRCAKDLAAAQIERLRP